MDIKILLRTVAHVFARRGPNAVRAAVVGRDAPRGALRRRRFWLIRGPTIASPAKHGPACVAVGCGEPGTLDPQLHKYVSQRPVRLVSGNHAPVSAHTTSRAIGLPSGYAASEPPELGIVGAGNGATYWRSMCSWG